MYVIFGMRIWQAKDKGALPHINEDVSLLWCNEAATRFTHFPPLLAKLQRHSQYISNVKAFADSSARAVYDTQQRIQDSEVPKGLHAEDTRGVLVVGSSTTALCLTY